ncbi:MAG: hypothetical protein KatS3mg131_2572 [Candidatus Tectimicrobiota bacterium]|nr:MAG: hypothetical protein KatS3mg131_2572 [Candidatus Tectomicrobia bacterium]
MAHERLADYQAVILCNVEALPPHVWQQLYQFVYEGGGLAFFAGNRVKPASYNAQLYQTATPLLPLPLGEAVQRPETAPLTIAAFDATHPLMRPFAGEEEILQRPRFYRYLRLEGWQAASDVRVILRLQDENPLLVEKRLGRGTVLFFATTADRDWTDLPTRTAYVPLMHGLASHLARLAAAAQRPGVLMPQPFVYAAPSVEAGTALTVITADGQRRLSRFRREGEQSVAEFAAYSVPGLYRLQTPEGPDLLPVNATRRESRFEKLQADDLQTRWRPLPVVLEDEAAFGRTAHQTLPAKELAGLLLVVLVAVLAVENVWSNRL